MSPRSISLVSANPNLELAAMKAVRTQVSSSPAVNVVRSVQPVSSTAVALSAAAPAAATADYGDLIRKARQGDEVAAKPVGPPWIVGDVASEDASAVTEAKALTSSFIGGTAGLQALGRTQFRHRADVVETLDAPAPNAPKAAQVGPLKYADTAAIEADPAQPSAASQARDRGSTERSKAHGVAADEADVAGLRPLIDDSDDRRFWTGSGYETVNSEGINLTLLKKIVDSQSLLERIEAEQSADKGLAGSERLTTATIDLPGLGAARSRPDLMASGSGLTQYLSSPSQSIDTKI